jgi:hypothetical protein
MIGKMRTRIAIVAEAQVFHHPVELRIVVAFAVALVKTWAN